MLILCKWLPQSSIWDILGHWMSIYFLCQRLKHSSRLESGICYARSSSLLILG